MTIQTADRPELVVQPSWRQSVGDWLHLDAREETTEEGGMLAKVPPILLLLLCPLLGLLFVVFLPLVGFGMIAYILLRPVLRRGAKAAHGGTEAVSSK